MPIFYRNLKTKRLVTLAKVTPRHYTGHKFIEIDAITKEEKEVKKGVHCIGHEVKIDPQVYKPVAHY